ncbi:(R)-mandelonitrile lyase [Pseudoprimorskyibacter insulae]|uniref:Cupin type-2 domain-containing protein n=1 Tax=Pseudoprimorskyibacter insulae TaxID=1695997 RepID=A0A2R8B043_9RHOB|nr:cupin domain-containing protein [Pseudoprimorskyibacter insulae]SPF81638.1 hypothetical protein PRI8871_03463 [Pseudoprimorskyibacter insulae]
MQIHRNGSRPTVNGPSDRFTGHVWQDPIISTPAPGLLKSNLVHFDPGARTAWHTHPMGQTLYVTQGSGLIQRWDGEAHFIVPGDVIWIPPGEKHWHGARSANGMTHVSMQESEPGDEAVVWLEHVTDDQYTKAEALAAKAAQTAG